MHPVQRRYFVEELLRLRSAGEQRRTVASQRSGRVDANPHQIDAVVFALRRIPEGGCILADEVGLGKTIEAGLVLAQLAAEGRERFLLITPKSLLGQWRDELFSLFGIEAQEVDDAVDLRRPGVYLVTRDFAGGERGAALLGQAPPFELCVVDEAHEIFAGLHKRFDRDGNYREDAPQAVMAGRVREVLQGTPVLLLTATPIQNSLAELWGLAQWVEPSGTLLGNLRTFRALFCDGDDRKLAEGQEDELRRRVAQICQRTLRRQAQKFMKQPFVQRRTRLYTYSMSPPERELYEDVTSYLLQPGVYAFRGNHRRLLLIGFHRLMASSLPALASSLERVAERLRKLLAGPQDSEALDADGEALLDDLEDDERHAASDREEGGPPDPALVQAELELVESFVTRARGLSSDAKVLALLSAVRLVLERGKAGEGSGKMVIFTESLTTQAYLRDMLLEHGVLPADAVTLFRGDNRGERVQQALERWQREVLPRLAPHSRPSPQIAVRLALVHEFASHSRVFISTEAGAKGLNLQCADTLINYDLPWNPQRIEQRIGRIHRYGQKTDVTVVNFIARDIEAQQLLFEILSRKLDLFGTVLDASDRVLHEPSTDAPESMVGALSGELEGQLRRIYERARSQAELADEMRRLRDEAGPLRERFEATHRRTAGLIESRFDNEVQQVFQRIQTELPAQLRALDRDLEQVLLAYLAALGVEYTHTRQGARSVVELSPDGQLPEGFREGARVLIGEPEPGNEPPLHPGHPLITAALEEARHSSQNAAGLRLQLPEDAPAELLKLRGRRGRLRLVKVRYQGFETVEQLLAVAQCAGSHEPLPEDLAQALLGYPTLSGEVAPVAEPSSLDIDDAVEECLFMAQDAVAAREQEAFARALARIERSVEDRLLLLQRQRAELQQQLRAAQTRLNAAVGPEARTQAEKLIAKLEGRLEPLQTGIEQLELRADAAYQRCVQGARERRYRPPQLESLYEVEFELA